MSDAWGYMTSSAADQAAQEAERNARERRTLAELLLARGQHKAAALVAMSGYRSDCVDNWNGGMYEVVLSVPVAQFDQVDADIKAALHAAAEDITGSQHFSGVGVEVQLVDAAPGWERDLFNRLFRDRQTDAPVPFAVSESDSDADHRTAGSDVEGA